MLFELFNAILFYLFFNYFIIKTKQLQLCLDLQFYKIITYLQNLLISSINAFYQRCSSICIYNYNKKKNKVQYIIYIILFIYLVWGLIKYW